MTIVLYPIKLITAGKTDYEFINVHHIVRIRWNNDKVNTVITFSNGETLNADGTPESVAREIIGYVKNMKRIVKREEEAEGPLSGFHISEGPKGLQ